MRISRISKTKQGRFALFDEDDAFLFSVDDETFFKNHIVEDMELDDTDLAQLKAKSDTRKAKDKALGYLSLRDYASGELYDKLCQKYDVHTAAEAVAAMQQLGLLNDAAFAKHRVQYLAGQRKSTREIRQHLMQKGVDRAIIEETLAQLEPSDTDAAEALVRKSYLRKLQAGETQKVLAALARHGFAYRDAKEAIARCAEDLELETEPEDVWE